MKRLGILSEKLRVVSAAASVAGRSNLLAAGAARVWASVFVMTIDRQRRRRFTRSLSAKGVALAGITLSVAWCAVAGCRSREEPAEPPRYNLLLITLDTTRADYLSCYGYNRQITPRLDALAADAIRFDTAIAQSALTPPSHATILTGLVPAHHGVRVLYAASGYRLSEGVPTLATTLLDKGWRTGAFLSAFPVSEFYGFDRGFETFDNGLSSSPDEAMYQAPDGRWLYDTPRSQRRADKTTDEAVAWMRATKEPFFMWVHYFDPHDPSTRPPAEVIAQFPPPSSSSSWAERLALYPAEVFYMDSQVGRLLDALRELGQYERTAIVVLADHGEGLGDHDHWFHRILYQEQIRVPMIMRLPGKPTGGVISELVRTTDVYPTALEFLGVEPPAPVDGSSLLGLIDGRPELPRLAYAEALILYDFNATNFQKTRPNDDLLYCLMDRSWKLIYRERRPDASELYHLPSDPREQNNVYPTQPEQARRLVAGLEQLDPFVTQPFGDGMDQDVLERLRSLGYLDDAGDD